MTGNGACSAVVGGGAAFAAAGTGAFGGQRLAIEDAVAREVSRRVSSVEVRFDAMMRRLEAFLDSADVHVDADDDDSDDGGEVPSVTK